MARRSRNTAKQGGTAIRGRGRPNIVIAVPAVDMGSLRLFPGAEGPAAAAVPAARQAGHTIEIVSTRAEYETAMLVSNPKSIIFNQSGNYVFTSAPDDDDDQTDDTFIYGQSAPSPGIIFTTTGSYAGGNGFMQLTKNRQIMQHIALMPTHEASPSGRTIRINDQGNSNVDCVIDHCSLYWSGDAMTGPGGIRPTETNNLMAQPLFTAGRFYLTSSTDFLLMKCLLVHGHDRAPNTGDGASGSFINNGVYNQDRAAVTFHGGDNPPALDTFINFIANRVKVGPTGDFSPYTITMDSITDGSSIFYYNDLDEGGTIQVGLPGTGGASEWVIQSSVTGWTIRTSTVARALPSIINILAASAVPDYLENNAGSRPLDRNSYDAQMISDYANATGASVSSPGTPPTLDVNTRDWDAELTSDPSGTDAEGWTNFERQMQEESLKVAPSVLV